MRQIKRPISYRFTRKALLYISRRMGEPYRQLAESDPNFLVQDVGELPPGLFIDDKTPCNERVGGETRRVHFIDVDFHHPDVAAINAGRRYA